jgi:hypothetical protein
LVSSDHMAMGLKLRNEQRMEQRRDKSLLQLRPRTAALLWASALHLFASLGHSVGLDQLHWVV